jgi:hypothetical protein
MDLDGSNATVLVNTGTRTRGIDLDVPNGYIYWTEWADGTIARSDLTGANQTTLLSGLGNPQSISLDLANSKMYFTVQSVGIRVANLDGSNLLTLAAVGGDPEGLDVYTANQHIYYVQKNIGQVRRIDFSGAGDTLIYQDSAEVYDIHVDEVNNKLYWTTGASVGAGTIKRSDLDGSNVETLISGLNWVSGVALDVANNYAYYVITNSINPEESSINRMNLDGSGNINIITGGVASGARELTLIPEPSTYALIIGAVALGLVLLRRKLRLNRV